MYTRIFIIAFLVIIPSMTSCSLGYSGPDLFGIYISTLDGKNVRSVLLDSYREMNHVRVSPDKQWITFTRFNNKKFGIAEEKNGYLNTEIMICRLDGTGLKSLTPPQKFIVNVNSYWTPDGKSIIYMSNNNQNKRQIRIHHMNLNTQEITHVSPKGIPWVSDPHQVDDTIVFPAAHNPQTDVRAIWSMKTGNRQAVQITHPNITTSAKNSKPPLGDSDPKLSPDKSMVAFTRHFGKGNFHTIVKNLIIGKELDISHKKETVDVMPEWSSDGRLLVFWHVDMKNFKNIGIYTIKPDGSNRKMVPLPRGFHFKMPAFFPDDGSGKDARIIFTGKKVPQIK